MRIYIILVLIFNVITSPLYGMNTKKIKPLGIKNFPVPELNLDGVCAYIAKFQVLNAGLQAMSTEYKANGNNNLLWIMTQRYKQQQKEQTNSSFTFYLDEIKELHDSKGLPKLFNKYFTDYAWNNNHNKNFVIEHKSFNYKLHQNLNSYLQNTLAEYSSLNQKSLVIIDLSDAYTNQHTKHLCNVETIEELEQIKIPKFQSTYPNYKLVGVIQQHNYALFSKNFYDEKKDFRNMFYFTLPSGRFFIQKYNCIWPTHFDAYVNYNNSWYLMDDETRWNVSAKLTTENKNLSEKQQDSDLVAKALIDCYPGMPRMLIYAPTKTSTSSSDTSNSKKLSLTLKRDTKKSSVWKSLLILLGGALCDGIVVGGAVGSGLCAFDYTLEGQLATKQNLKISSIFGLITGCASFIYHGRRIIPMHRSQITYNSESPYKNLGPREE